MNKIITIILIVSEIIILIGMGIFVYNRHYSNRLIEKRKSISELYFPENKNNYSYKQVHSSMGLIMDQVIVHNALKYMENIPDILFETFPLFVNSSNQYIFINEDISSIRILMNTPWTPRNILCKTKHAYSILNNLPNPYNKKIMYTGFTSVDKYSPKVNKNYEKIIHTPGKSPYKGTLPLIEIWKKHPEWPVLTIIYYKPKKIFERWSYGMNLQTNVDNIEIIDKYLDDDEHTKLVNECGIHICSSENEGFGHYLNEAKSMKSIVLYTDGQSMNELFTPYQTGIPIECEMMKTGLCPKYKITQIGLEKAMQYLLGMNSEQKKRMGELTRLQYLENDSNFRKNIKVHIKTPEIHKLLNLMNSSHDIEGWYAYEILNLMNSSHDIEGWYAYEILNKLFINIHRLQRGKHEVGSVGEIGVHHGRLFCPLSQLTDPSMGEKRTAIDLFDNQDENIDDSGRGDLKNFVNNCKKFKVTDGLEIMQINSNKLNPAYFKNLYRLFSIDGGHTRECVISDLNIVSSIMTNYGVIIVDDFWHVDWVGVWEGTMHFLKTQDEWIPFYVSPLHNGTNKLLLCRKEHQQIYMDLTKDDIYKNYYTKNMNLSKPKQDKHDEVPSWTK